MTINAFKARVYGFINRDPATFNTVSGQSTDHVLQAMNDARRSAQRSYAFELNRDDVFLTTSEYGANWLTGCTTVPSGTVEVLMKRIDSVWNYTTTSTTAGTVYSRISKIDLGSSGDFKRELPIDGGSLTLNQQSLTVARRKFAFLNGATLKIATVSTATPVLLNGIKFLEDYAASDTPDIFLTYFSDWLLWATLIQLNQFLKDSERINIDAAFVGRLWESVKEMDGQIANAGDGNSLD